MAFTVIYDASVLYPSILRDVLIRVARMGLVRARWSEDIMDEVFRAIKEDRPDLDPDKLDRTRKLMCEAIPDCLVPGYRSLIGSIREMPDEDDRHVVATAIKAGAQVIVTSNLKHFPASVLDEFDIEAKSPDSFLQDVYDIDGAITHQAVTEAAAACKSPPMTVTEVVDALYRLGLPIAASLLRR